MSDVFKFDWFTLRPTVLDDFLLATRWNDADVYHRGVLFGEFWLQQGEIKQSFLLVDPQGPVFFFKMEFLPKGEHGELEMYIQFGPADEVSHRRTIRGLVAGLAWLEKRVLQQGFKEIYSSSKNPALIAFCKRRLGAVEEDGRLMWRLSDGSEKVDPESRKEDGSEGHEGEVWKGHGQEDRRGEESGRRAEEGGGVRGEHERPREEARA